MIQAPAGTRGIVDEIVERLISKFNPRRIYLFGSRARGDARFDSDYDFLIEIEKVPRGVTVTRQGMAWLDDLDESEIQLHLRAPGELEQQKDDPGTIDWDVVREGRLVFALDDLPEIKPGPKRKMVREGRGDPPDSFDGWIEHAERDMRLATHLTSDFTEWKESICFNSQQAAEKFLKALIISRHARPERTHKLVRLIRQLRKLGLEAGDVGDDAAYLSAFAVEVRYPRKRKRKSAHATVWLARPFEVTESQARRAFAAAQRIEAAVRAHLP